MSSTDFLRRIDQAHHLHPFTDHRDMFKAGTSVIQSGKGVFVFDQDGRPLLDGLAGLWCVNVGYDCPEIRDAVTAQLDRLPYYCSFFNSTTEPAIELSAKLASLAPKRINHTLFCSSGSESNESALKIIRNYFHLLGKPQKRKLIARNFAYHGVTIATTSLTGLPGCYLPFDLPLDGFLLAPGPHPYGYNSNLDAESFGKWCVDETAKLIKKEGADTIAAMFVEPIQGAGGVIVPPRSYLTAIRELCRENDILFVADEVITGFGRLGDWFASNLWELDPDLISTAKGITSGYLPLGASLISDEIAQTLIDGGYFAHGFTYSGHPVTTAAALANLEVIEKKKLIPYVKDDIGPYFQEKIRALSGHPAVSETRGFGLIGALELVPRGGRASLTPTSPLGAKAAGLIRKHGAIVRGIRDLIALSPPLVITHAEVDQLFESVRLGLDELWN